MNYIDTINDIINKNNGIIRWKDLKKNNIPSIYLTRMQRNGEIIKVDRGIYISKDGDFDEYYFFNQRYNRAIFSHLSSLYLNEFTDIIPQSMYITLPSGYNPHRIRRDVNINYIKKEYYHIGLTSIETMYGNKVNAYDIERTICDIIRDFDNVDTEIINKTLNRYIRYKDKNLNKLYDYSKKMGIQDKTSRIMGLLYE